MHIILFKGEPVVETNEVASMFNTTSKDVMAVFLQNKERFQEGVHYYLLDNRFEDLEEFKKEQLNKESADQTEVYLWMYHGLYELAELLNGKFAWYAYCKFIYELFNISDDLEKAIKIVQKAKDRIVKHETPIIPFKGDVQE